MILIQVSATFPFLLLGTTLLVMSTTTAEEECTATTSVLGTNTVECNKQILGESVQFSLTLKLCRKQPTLSYEISGFGLYLHLQDQPCNVKIPLGKMGDIIIAVQSKGFARDTLSLSFKPLISPVAIPLYSEDIDSNCNPVFYWFNSLSNGELIALGVGAFLAFVVFGCLCRRCCCQGSSTPGVVIAQGPQFIPQGPQLYPPSSNISYSRMPVVAKEAGH